MKVQCERIFPDPGNVDSKNASEAYRHLVSNILVVGSAATWGNQNSEFFYSKKIQAHKKPFRIFYISRTNP